MQKAVTIALLILLLGGGMRAMPSLLPINIVDIGDSRNLTSWEQYHNYAQIVAILLALNRTFPNIVDVFSIGRSFLGREIYCVRLTNENDTSAKPEVYFDGCHHAREQITSELTLFFVVYVATNYGLDMTVTGLLNNCDVYVVVALDVDGSFDRSRTNARGVDLNRNYDYAWAGAGGAPFSEPETLAIRDFTLARHFKYALSFHSGIELVLYPWSCTRQPPLDALRLAEISKGISDVTQGTQHEQSCFLYIANGTWGDWMYGVAGVPAITCEIFGIGPFGQPFWYGSDPKPLPSTGYDVEINYRYNPHVEYIKPVLRRWLPAFFYVMDRAVQEAHRMP